MHALIFKCPEPFDDKTVNDDDDDDDNNDNRSSTAPCGRNIRGAGCTSAHSVLEQKSF